MSEKEQSFSKVTKPWAPAGVLKVQGKAPQGMRLRYCRIDDRTNLAMDANLQKKLEEGWVFVHGKDGIYLDGGTDVEGAVRKRDVVLMMMPEEMAQSREQYFADRAEAQEKGQNLDAKGNLADGHADEFSADAKRMGVPTHGSIKVTRT